MCHWDVVWESCGSECTLTSPGYPGMYPPNTECVYYVRSSNENVAFQLFFTGLNRHDKPREFDIRPGYVRSTC